MKLARAYIAEWLLSRVLIRRARRELRDRRTAFQHTEAFRRDAAVRCIQPLWRGAALRSRLRRLLHVEDEEDAFAKVNVNDWLTEDPSALAPVELLLHPVVGSASEVAAVPFDVSPAIALKVDAATGRGEPAASPPTFTPAPPRSEQRRVHTGASASGRPSPRQEQPRSTLSAGTSAEESVKKSNALEEQWGPAVAAQLRKKQQKNMRANNERMRKEFVSDPLRVQQEMRGAHSTHKSK